MNEEKIKRLGQFLFDNAEFIAAELQKSEHYRSLAISCHMFKGGDHSRDMETRLTIYDERTHHHRLEGPAICLDRLKQIWRQVNEDTEVEPMPEPEKVRDKL